jgi:16S rRNA (uracil1498-N3)-methyltransferase
MVSSADLQATELVVTDASVLTYLGKSLRLRPGQELEFFDGLGGARRGQLKRIEQRLLRGEWLEPFRQEPRLGPSGPIPILARLKGGDEEEAVAALASLGLPEIRLFQAEREPSGRTGPGKQAFRWQRISDDSCRQSGAYWRTEIRWFDSLSDALCDLDTLVFGDASGVAVGSQDCNRLGVVIGPEGGLTDLEQQLLLARGARAVCLGTRVLRARHAASLLPAAILALEGACQ